MVKLSRPKSTQRFNSELQFFFRQISGQLKLLFRRLCDLLFLIIVVENDGFVLRPDIRELTVVLGRVYLRPKYFHQATVSQRLES